MDIDIISGNLLLRKRVLLPEPSRSISWLRRRASCDSLAPCSGVVVATILALGVTLPQTFDFTLVMYDLIVMVHTSLRFTLATIPSAESDAVRRKSRSGDYEVSVEVST